MDDPASLPAIPPPRTRCLCGARTTVYVTVEYIQDGQLQWTGGRFCYEHLVHVIVPVPLNVTLTEIRIYGWHKPDEMVKVVFTPPGEHADAA